MATLSSSSSSRVPIRVQHSPNNTSNINENYYYRTTSRVASPTPLSTTTSINIEPEGIKQRMREFEDRCTKWREEFFARNGSNIHNLSAFSEFDSPPPPPPPPSSSHLFGISPFSTKQQQPSDTQFNSIYQPLKTPTFSSSLHKSFVEDSRDGGKKLYKVEFEIGDFKENELVITTQGNLLIVKGDREIKVGSTTETKTFNREITVPEYVNTSNLHGFLTGTLLTIEAPIKDEVYHQRRSTLNSTSSSIPSVTPRSIIEPRTSIRSQTSSTYSPTKSMESSKQSTESQVHQESTSRYSSSKSTTQPQNSSYLISLQPTSKAAAAAPEMVSGYPQFNKDDNCTIYKFDLKGFNQADISLSITEKKTLEIKASKEISDSIGKSYREFKREIQLDDNVDINSITNVLSNDGILTLKMPLYQTIANGSVSSLSSKSAPVSSLKATDFNNNNNNVSNNNNNNSSCQEYFSSDGKLVKLIYDLGEYEPENLKIILTTNNELKITAQIVDQSKSNRVQKQCSRQYSLPSYIHPEQMRAVMSRDGQLTVEFSGLNQHIDQRMNLKA
jgi:HSP20 family molecular chaperone IbpA